MDDRREKSDFAPRKKSAARRTIAIILREGNSTLRDVRRVIQG